MSRKRVYFHDICIAGKKTRFPGKEPGYGQGTVKIIKCHLRVTNRRGKTVHNRLKYGLKRGKVDRSFCECGYLVFFMKVCKHLPGEMLWNILFI